MSVNQNNAPRFWKELKRRKVVRVITVYAASSFAILELVSIIVDPLKLPQWFLPVVIVLLCIGFIIAIILSWIYDTNPDGNFEKTLPLTEFRTEDMPKTSNGWKIASYISFTVIAGLIVFHILVSKKGKKEQGFLDKSIAVLPFINDSPDKGNEYFINGTMESILNDLCKVKDLRVISRSSVEQFRDTVIPVPEVASKLVVSYVLEGSMQKYGNRIRMTIQLIDRNDNHVWSEQYDRELGAVNDLIDVQSEIAQLVAEELNALITPGERERIKATPTSNMNAYEYYLAGNQMQFAASSAEDYKKALEYFEKAIETDSSFAEAYISLAGCYGNLAFYGSLRPVEAYPRIRFFAEKVIDLDPLSGDAFNLLAISDYYYKFDFASAYKNLSKAMALAPNNAKFYKNLAEFDTYLGRFEEAKAADRRAVSLDPLYPHISSLYALHLYYGGEKDSAMSLLERQALRFDDVEFAIGFLFLQEEEYKTALSRFGNLEDLSTPFELVQYGLASFRTGHPDTARIILAKLETRAKDEYVSYTLRGALLCELGEKQKALEYFQKGYEEREEYLLMLMYFDKVSYTGMRADPAFKEIMRKVMGDSNH